MSFLTIRNIWSMIRPTKYCPDMNAGGMLAWTVQATAQYAQPRRDAGGQLMGRFYLQSLKTLRVESAHFFISTKGGFL